MKTLLRNGNIYDGTGGASFIGDVLVEGNRILAVGNALPTDTLKDVETVIDLNGLSVAPGFIDAHSHNDWFSIKKEPLKYFEPFIRQGITTFVTGNCGLSTTGYEKDSKYIDKMGGGLFFYNDTTGKYGNMNDYFNAIDGNTPCNIAALIGHCSARAGVAGMENSPLTADDEKKMLSVLEEGLKQGACGISLGLMYEPGIYADTEELKKVAQLCIKYDRPLTVHPRACSAVSMAYPELFGRSHLLRAADELAEVAKGTTLKLQYSHAIFVGRKSFKDKDELIEIFQKLRKTGVDAQFDIYHEVLGVSVITVVLPSWYQAMSESERKKPLNKLKLRLLSTATSKLLGFGFNDIEIAYLGEGYPQYEGKTVHQIAQEIGKSDFNTYLYLCEISHFSGRVNMGPYSTPEIISDLSKNEYCLYMTDSWVEENGVQNPAIYDCFPKFLRSSLLETGDTVPKTIRKMSGGVADRFNLAERGYLKPGYFADITVFNEDELKKATPDQTKSFGIKKVFINGKLVLDGDNLDTDTAKTTGAAVRVK